MRTIRQSDPHKLQDSPDDFVSFATIFAICHMLMLLLRAGPFIEDLTGSPTMTMVDCYGRMFILVCLKKVSK